MSRSRVAVIATALATLPPHAAIAQASAAATRLEGVWSTVGPPGRAIFHGNSYIMVMANPDSSTTSTPPSESDQARLFRTMVLEAGTFSIADTIMTVSPSYGKYPRAGAPRSWKLSYALKGDTLTWHVLDAKGRAASSGVSVRTSR